MEQISTLVVHASSTEKMEPFTPWNDAKKTILTLAQWMPRELAELDLQWQQLIPSAIISDGHGNYYTFPRTSDTRRPELSEKLSIIIGGHPDDEDRRSDNISHTMRNSLVREIAEETNAKALVPQHPIGTVTDQTTKATAQHIGIIYEVQGSGQITARASEEFKADSPENGNLMNIQELTRISQRLDPWSAILVRQMTAHHQTSTTNPGRKPKIPTTEQRALPI